MTTQSILNKATKMALVFANIGANSASIINHPGASTQAL